MVPRYLLTKSVLRVQETKATLVINERKHTAIPKKKSPIKETIFFITQKEGQKIHPKQVYK
jgi:hypothetical protein